MSIKLSINRQALSSMIESDPEMYLELSNAVVSEVVRKFAERDAARIIEQVEPELFKKFTAVVIEDATLMAKITADMEARIVGRSKTAWKSAELSPAANELFREGVEQAIASVQATIYSRALVNAELAAASILETLDERVEKRVERKFEEGLNEIVESRVKEKLRQIAQGLST